MMSIGLACSIGLHWVLLQPIAWTTMLAGNLRSFSFSEAVQRTFDGKHPCALCKAVADGKKSEKKSELLVPLKKFEGTSQIVSLVVFPPACFPRIEAGYAIFQTLARTPPVPPPRAG